MAGLIWLPLRSIHFLSSPATSTRREKLTFHQGTSEIVQLATPGGRLLACRRLAGRPLGKAKEGKEAGLAVGEAGLGYHLRRSLSCTLGYDPSESPLLEQEFRAFKPLH